MCGYSQRSDSAYIREAIRHDRKSVNKSVGASRNIKEEAYMCNNGIFGNNSCSWIIILLIILCCCGGNNGSCGESNGCGCGC